MTGLYKAPDGSTVAVLGVVRNESATSNGSRMVLYFSLGSQSLHVRDMADFHAPVAWPDGVKRPRFDLVTA